MDAELRVSIIFTIPDRRRNALNIAIMIGLYSIGIINLNFPDLITYCFLHRNITLVELPLNLPSNNREALMPGTLFACYRDDNS